MSYTQSTPMFETGTFGQAILKPKNNVRWVIFIGWQEQCMKKHMVTVSHSITWCHVAGEHSLCRHIHIAGRLFDIFDDIVDIVMDGMVTVLKKYDDNVKPRIVYSQSEEAERTMTTRQSALVTTVKFALELPEITIFVLIVFYTIFVPTIQCKCGRFREKCL